MRTAIIGCQGQLGTALQSCLTGDIVPLTHADVDITDSGAIDRVLSAAAADCIVNASAYNFVDRAEGEPEAAYRVNALGPRHLAKWCGRTGALLVHVSTDYVFGADVARRSPYQEIDAPGPTSAYAMSKLAGEDFIRAESPRNLIVRTCGLYGRASTVGKGNFVKTVLRLAADRKELTIVDDQHCTPSFADDVAAAIVSLISTGATGLYHLTNAGSTTWYGFACEVIRRSQLNVAVRPITSAEYPQKARRPAYSVLDCTELTRAIGSPMPTWEDALDRYLGQLADGS